jgi:hypothetical protein
MGTPALEVGYTLATTRRGRPLSLDRHVVAVGEKNLYSVTFYDLEMFMFH